MSTETPENIYDISYAKQKCVHISTKINDEIFKNVCYSLTLVPIKKRDVIIAMAFRSKVYLIIVTI